MNPSAPNQPGQQPIAGTPPPAAMPGYQPPVAAPAAYYPTQPSAAYGAMPLAQPGAAVPGQAAVGGQPTPPTKPVQATTNPNSTQNTLQIAEIRDGIVIMNDGSFRSVLMVKSVNFDLMSPQEQEAVEYSYQGFLNSLYFPVQIFLRSSKVDLRPYIEKLDKIRSEHDNMLLALLMDDYINFIDVLSQEANIMDKSFFVVVPYYPTGDLTNVIEQSKGIFGKLFAKPQTTATKIDKVTYDKAKDEIKNRVDSVTSGLFQIGVNSVQLNTKELGELYYNMYNPDTAVREPLGDFERVTSTFVRKGEGEAPRPHLQEGGM